MGCGQSKIGIIYPRKSKNKSGRKKSGSEVDSDEEDAEADCGAGTGEDADARRRCGGGGGGSGGGGGGGGGAPDGGDACDGEGPAGANKPLAPANTGPLLAQSEISSSQMDFFRMLDEKIENGPDYDSSSEEEKAAERARLRALLRDWETASQASSARGAALSAPVTPAHPPPLAHAHAHAHALALGRGPAPNANGDLHLHRPPAAATVAAAPCRAWPPVASPLQCYHYPPLPGTMQLPMGMAMGVARWCQQPPQPPPPQPQPPPPPHYQHYAQPPPQHYHHHAFAPHPVATSAGKCYYPPVVATTGGPPGMPPPPHAQVQVQWCQPPLQHNSVVQYRKSRGVYTELA